MRALFFMLVLANAACLRKTEFQCSDDSSCGAAGKCETTGFCSFANADCPSGRSYDQSAGSLAGECVGGGNPTDDGGVVDAPSNTGDDGSMTDAPTTGCPSGYAALTGAQAGHLYKVLATPQNWATQEAGCQATTLASHLAVPDDLAELTALDTAAGMNYWLGITDSAQEGVYRNVLGAIQTFLPWEAGAPNNAGGGQGEDCVEGLPPQHQINDRRCQDKLPAVCECVP
jgi:lectin-like protein